MIFILIWIAIFTWFDKDIEAYVIEKWYFDITNFEYEILDKYKINK